MTTKLAQVPHWYASIKRHRTNKRIFNYAITNPNSNVLKSILFLKFKIPMTQSFNNIAEVFREIIKHADDEQKTLTAHFPSDLSRVAQQTPPNNERLALPNVDIDEFETKCTEYYSATEVRRVGTTQHDVDGVALLTDLREAWDEDNLDEDRLEELISAYAYDSDDLYLETLDAELEYSDDPEYIDSGDSETEYNTSGTCDNIVRFLQDIQNDPSLRHLAQPILRNTTIEELLERITEISETI